MMEVDNTGKLRSKMRPGDVTITVMTVDGRFQHSIKITIDNSKAQWDEAEDIFINSSMLIYL